MKRLVRPSFYLDTARAELWLLEHAGGEIADRWHEALWRTIEFLAPHPFVGREGPDLSHRGIRSWRVKGFERWLIFYGARDSALVLYRVVSGPVCIYCGTSPRPVRLRSFPQFAIQKRSTASSDFPLVSGTQRQTTSMLMAQKTA